MKLTTLPIIALSLASLLLSACATKPTQSRYQHAQDFSPVPMTNADLDKIQEPTPRVEPLSVMGNPKSYTVLGKEYRVMSSAKDYKEQGEASWYGMKFHGHQTSNGEIYDVYQYSAAHKTLPLPSYVKVTRLDNGQSVVVRVNDRGPFHTGRIIDLSYAAAKKLGIDKLGVAKVEVEALVPQHTAPERWIQVGAYSNLDSAMKVRERIEKHLQQTAWPIVISQQNNLNKVRIGPIPEGDTLNEVVKRLQELNLGTPTLLGAHQL